MFENNGISLLFASLFIYGSCLVGLLFGIYNWYVVNIYALYLGNENWNYK
jgi:hypothetical protein